MFCSKCGAQLNEEALFCDKCGIKIDDVIPKRVTSAKESTTTRSIKKPSMKIIIAIAAVAAVIATGLMVAFIFGRGLSDIPTVATTRRLSAARVGDDSDWIEIATNGRYSLILRVDNIGTSRFNPEGGGNNFVGSEAQAAVDNWWNTVSSLASIRTNAVGHNALTRLGHFGDADESDGFSNPIGGSESWPFLLSVQEAARFVSTSHYDVNAENFHERWPDSQAGARTNWGADRLGSPREHWWLRSPGNRDYRMAAVSYRGNVNGGSGFQTAVETDGFLVLRPALWVNSTIFD